ncbi:putative fasciclin-like arabinogalactan protein [Dioscorea sansibarensis]
MANSLVPMAATFLLVLAFLPSFSEAHNITKILAQHPEFSTFNHYLTITHLAAEINRRLTITVLAIDNSAMSAILAKHFTLPTLKNVLLLHVLVDYYGAKKLHQLTGGSATASSMFQATGAAPGTSGYVNISDHHGGKVSFSAIDDAEGDAPATPSSMFVKSIKEIPYNISIIQISAPLTSPIAEAPAAAPAPVNITESMKKKGCGLFSDLLFSSADVEKTFESNVDGGITIFCPIDSAVKSFMPKFKNLTSESKQSLLLFHGYPVYSSLQGLKSNNGLVTTLATDGGGKNFRFTIQNDGEDITLKTKAVTATIKSTIIDQDPCAIYSIDKVLEPHELFKEVETEAPAPAPAHAAKSPKGEKAASPPAPADGPDSAPADDKAADDNAGSVLNSGRFLTAVATVLIMMMV